jgi:predicted Zn-dependent peptidase
LYGDQPAGWPISGTKETVSRITRQDLISYMQSQYTSQNTIVCIAGNIKNELATKRAEEYFSRIKNITPMKKPKVYEKQKKPECLLHERKTDQTHIALGVRAFNIFHPQKYAQEILGIILGGMMSSRLFIKVRERLGLAYYINTSVSADTDKGFLVTQAGLENSKVERGILAILKEYKEISTKKISQKELQKAKDFAKGKMSLLLETSDAQASFFAVQELLKKEILTPEEIYNKIDKITQNDILKAAKEIFRPEKLNLALMGPFKDKEKFQRLLRF